VKKTIYIRKAIELREEIYQALKKETGEEGVSEKINEILYNALFKEKKKVFLEQWKRQIYQT
jgi:pyruvate/oxaloacetate carboxyltransferase